MSALERTAAAPGKPGAAPGHVALPVAAVSKLWSITPRLVQLHLLGDGGLDIPTAAGSLLGMSFGVHDLDADGIDMVQPIVYRLQTIAERFGGSVFQVRQIHADICAIAAFTAADCGGTERGAALAALRCAQSVLAACTDLPRPSAFLAVAVASGTLHFAFPGTQDSSDLSATVASRVAPASPEDPDVIAGPAATAPAPRRGFCAVGSTAERLSTLVRGVGPRCSRDVVVCDAETFAVSGGAPTVETAPFPVSPAELRAARGGKDRGESDSGVAKDDIDDDEAKDDIDDDVAKDNGGDGDMDGDESDPPGPGAVAAVIADPVLAASFADPVLAASFTVVKTSLEGVDLDPARFDERAVPALAHPPRDLHPGARLHGRDDELAQLAAWPYLGRTAVVLASPGMGSTRFIDALLGSVGNIATYDVVRVRCGPLSSLTPLGVWFDAFEALCPGQLEIVLRTTLVDGRNPSLDEVMSVVFEFFVFFI
jgi:hypothetical protein